MGAFAQLLCVVVSLTGGIHCVSLLRNSKPPARSGEPLKLPSRSTRRKSVCAKINRFCQVLLATTFLAVAASLLAVFAYRTIPSLWGENPIEEQLRESVEIVSIEGCPTVVVDYDTSRAERPIVGIDCAARHVSDRHLRRLLKEAPKLHYLNLQQTDITNDAIRQLDGAARLHQLTLDVTRVGDLGLQHLARLQNLEDLSLDQTNITSAGLRHLADLKDLRWLSLRDTAITDTGLESLYHLDKLRELDLTGTRVTPQGISRLQSRLPGLAVTPHPGNKTLR
ncbi:MAG: leucine-rich repeat domain-containing protein [Thermoguttaceae bacterium]